MTSWGSLSGVVGIEHNRVISVIKTITLAERDAKLITNEII